jgi:hypothetical protein
MYKVEKKTLGPGMVVHIYKLVNARGRGRRITVSSQMGHSYHETLSEKTN